MTDADAWLYSGGSMDALPELAWPLNGGREWHRRFRYGDLWPGEAWGARHLMHGHPWSPSDWGFDPRVRPYGWWRTAEVRQLVEDAAQSRRFEARGWLTPWTDSIAEGNEMVATLRARGRL